jgi:hypothetical protein
LPWLPLHTSNTHPEYLLYCHGYEKQRHNPSHPAAPILSGAAQRLGIMIAIRPR